MKGNILGQLRTAPQGDSAASDFDSGLGEIAFPVEICGRVDFSVRTFLNSCYFVVLRACLPEAYQRSLGSNKWDLPAQVGDRLAIWRAGLLHYYY